MTTPSLKAWSAFILGDMPRAEAEAFEKRLRTDTAFARACDDLQSGLTAMTLGLEPEPGPRASTKDRLMARVGNETSDGLLASLARLCDVTTTAAQGFMELLDGWEAWDLLLPRVRFLDVDGGPALAGARPGLVHIQPGTRFPQHVHRGAETSLFLQGQATFDDGSTQGRGDLLKMADGSTHGFTVTSDQPLIFAVVLGEIEMLGGEDT